jgi:hypothetical protein
MIKIKIKWSICKFLVPFPSLPTEGSTTPESVLAEYHKFKIHKESVTNACGICEKSIRIQFHNAKLRAE